MYTFITIITIIVCILIVLIVLIQNPKGGGLSSNFASSTQVMGVKKTGDFLEQATWGLIITLFVLTLSLNFFTPRAGDGTPENSLIQEQLDQTEVPNQPAPTTSPAPTTNTAPADSAK